MSDKLVALMYQSWADLDRAVSGLSQEEATARHDGGSSVAWTVGHVTNMVDSWLNVRFQGTSPHPVIGRIAFRTGGSGVEEDWPSVLVGVKEVQEAARSFLEPEQPADLDLTIAYDGSIAYLRPVGLSLRYAVMRIAAHHFLHVGEIVTIRARLGHKTVEVLDWGASLV